MNNEEKKTYNKAYYLANKEKIKTNSKTNYLANKENKKAYSRAYNKANKERDKTKRKAYYEANKEKHKTYMKAYREANKENIKIYQKKNKQKRKDYIKAYNKNRRKKDPLFKLSCYLRTRTSTAIKSKCFKKKSTTAKILGASYKIVYKHLERQFKNGMNWDNYGKWHIDHIIPLSSANTEDELISLCHFRNLQPLWAKDNFCKSNKINKTN